MAITFKNVAGLRLLDSTKFKKQKNQYKNNFNREFLN